MSTDHQKYSTANQEEAITRYAATRGLTICRTYSDGGKSGLRLDGRDALQCLIDDVQSGQADFGAILVYDVSRWGRFQDADESAHYEFICKSAGIAVHYCAEQFDNDGSISATLLKSVKRVMAGEYSRELSAKVFAGQCRLIRLGFRQGGPPGYGLRRQLLDEHRSPKALLRSGERKSLQTDRVILVPGPAHEIETVRRIYRLFVSQGRSETQIAAMLNSEGIANERGLPWGRAGIHQVLTNEKYVGNNVYNRVSFKLKQRRVVNPPDMWVRAPGAFEAIVDEASFRAARQIIEDRSRHFTDEELLTHLKRLLEERGALSGLIIDETDHIASSTVYRVRFGSLVRAYRLVGYVPARDYTYIETNRALRTVYADVVADTVAKIEGVGGTVQQDAETDLLTVNGEFTASVVIVRAQTTPGGALRWKVRFDVGLSPDITVAVRMNASNEAILDYYLLPRIDFQTAMLRIAEDNGVFLDAYRFYSLDSLSQLSSRTVLQEAA
jgi:DNA invertase Pin-like site-specific DNA recombinase